MKDKDLIERLDKIESILTSAYSEIHKISNQTNATKQIVKRLEAEQKKALPIEDVSQPKPGMQSYKSYARERLVDLNLYKCVSFDGRDIVIPQHINWLAYNAFGNLWGFKQSPDCVDAIAWASPYAEKLETGKIRPDWRSTLTYVGEL